MTEAKSQTSRTLLDQAHDASDLAERAFAAGNASTGIAAISLAAQLVKLARLQKEIADGLQHAD